MLKIDTKVEPSPFLPAIVAVCEWTVKRLPAWVTPNQVTIASLPPTMAGGVCLYLASFNQLWFIPAVALAFFHTFTDNLDGVLARTRNLASDRGMFLDFTVDALGLVAVFLGIAFAGYTLFVPFACYLSLVLLREVIVLLEIVLRGVFVIPFPGPGEIPFALVLLCALTAFGPRVVFALGSYPIGWFDLAAMVLGLGGLIDLVATVIRLYRQLPGPVSTLTG